MLSLIAQVSGEMALPETRAEFYQAAVSEMWSRKLSNLPDASSRTKQRDRVLTNLAQRMGMEHIEVSLSLLEQAASDVDASTFQVLIDYLKRAGIVLQQRWEKVSFVHLTFQEFYLARALRQRTFQQVLEHYWDDARYEETLGLQISLLRQDSQHTDIDQGIRWLVEWGEDTHRRDPHILWQKRRSPLRVALHLLHRSGVTLEQLPHTEGLLWEKVRRSIWRQWATAMDVKTPPYILKVLAQDAIESMHQLIAAHPSTPPETLTRLTQHANPHVRWQAAAHPSTLPGILAQLAQDTDSHMRWVVAGNPSTPPEILAQLVQYTERGTRRSITEHSTAPPETLTPLARNDAPNMRWQTATNLSTQPETLVRLAQDADRFVRQAVAGNPSTPPEILAQLARDANPDVRWGVAVNPSMLLEDL